MHITFASTDIIAKKSMPVARSFSAVSNVPHVCNGCPKAINHCTISHKYRYDAIFADRKYKECLSQSRADIKLEHQLGTYDFLTLFNTILTDCESEFGDPESLENGINGIILSSIYYCDPMRSGQKGGIEQAHTMLRMILPKKTSFEYLTQWDLRTIVDHINSTPRESLGGRTPYEVALENYGIDILKALQLRPIPPDEINLTPKLILFNH